MELALLVAPVALLMFSIECFTPRDRVTSPHWYPRALALSTLQVAIAYLGAATWQHWLPTPAWSGLLPPGLDVAIGYLAITFVYYWWHRARHEVPWLWRSMHQLHHSPVRLELLTSFYKHPAEMLLNGLLSSLILTTFVGLDARAATLAVAVTAIAELFYHWNVRTPWWLGFLVQRPEMHCVHHERGVHTSNFSDLPLWDWLFGTWRNPRERSIPCGFDDQRELQLVALLSGRDVHAQDALRDRTGAQRGGAAVVTPPSFSS
jgi:sterol desaturase/sphingolipid hydroxylase (fatty acid hydroxylase superfamily)